MNREVHVRICERLGVQIPGATRQPRIHAKEEPTGHRASARPYRGPVEGLLQTSGSDCRHPLRPQLLSSLS